jgi:P27 family predicted phage terminase small subunit
MAIRGTKPTPTNLALVRGNPGKRKLPDPAKEIRAPIEDPTPPMHLHGAGLEEWHRIVGTLVTLHIMTRLDRGALASYCQAYGRWVDAETALAKMAADDPQTRGLVVMTTHGNKIQNPLVGAANKAMADVVRYSAEFGMTPSSRTRLQDPTASGDNGNPFEDFRKSGT